MGTLTVINHPRTDYNQIAVGSRDESQSVEQMNIVVLSLGV